MSLVRRLFLVLLFPVLAFAQSADQEVVSVLDAPDPVTPGATLTYTITLTNHGPNAATNGGINGSLPLEVTYQSTVAPPGFTCTTFGAAVSCTAPSFAPGTVVFTMTVQVGAHLVSFPDGSFTATFSPSGTTPDPNPANNSKSATTSYNSPQIDIAVAASDLPDPVAPNQNVTYTVNVTNNGPDPATNAIFNMPHNGGSFTFQSMVTPAGWSCTGVPAAGGIANFSCTKATMAPMTTDTFTIVVKAEQANIGLNDTTINQNFNASATGNETNHANNTETESTAYVAPDANLAISVTDAPDPVTPDGDITYTATITSTGPDTATDVNFNVFNNNTLRFRSVTVPAGWSCPTLPPVDGNPVFTCTAASFANGATAVFTVVLRAYREVIGISDTTLQTVFSVGSNTVADPNHANNTETESTGYITPDSDIQITAGDSPDPVAPDGDITYTVTVTNAGPDTATNAILNVPMNNTLRFQSITVPAGWSCTPPAVGAGTSFSCTHPGFAVGSSVFTIVLRANDEQFGISDQTIVQNFNAGSGNADPNNGNNSVNVSTLYSTPDANASITASDSPDPVVNGGTLTFTVAATNAGPDAGTNAQVTMVPHPSLVFQSLNAPAGWTCTTPATGAAGVTTCTRASMASGETANFTLVTQLVISGSGGTLSSNFSISTAVQDPVPANNSVEVLTNWIGQSSDLSIAKTTLSTAAAQGSTITYTISTANNGPNDASNVTVTDVLHPSLRFQSITAPAGWSCATPAVGANGTVTCTIGTFTNGATAQFTLATTVAPNATGSITNSASIASTTAGDPNPGNSSGSSGTVAIAGNADLIVTKSAPAGSVPRGGTIQYTISITNAGPDPAASVVLTDVLPSSVRFQSIIAPGGWTCTTPAAGATGTITCTAASQPIGAPASFALAVTVAPTASGTITNTATASHSGPDASPGNSSSTTPPIPVTTAADLTIAKTTTATAVVPGQTFAYTIAVTNNGPDAATTVVVSDALPASLRFQSIAAPAAFTCTTPAAGATGTITCNAATLANGATATFTLTVQVAPGASGTISNTATVVAAEDTASSTAPNVVVTAAAEEANIPTLSEWALLGLMAMLGLVAVVRMRGLLG